MRHDYWTRPPGGSRSPRRVARTVIGSFLVGVLSIGVAWAGSGLVPITTRDTTKDAPAAGTAAFQGEGEDATTAGVPQIDLGQGQVLAGASSISIRPRPDDYGGQWVHAEWPEGATEAERNAAIEEAKAKCEVAGPITSSSNPMHTLTDVRVRWAENPNCLYMGGYSIGPVNSIVLWDDVYDLAVRSFAISDGQDVVVITILDGAYYFGTYASMCNTDQAFASVHPENKYTQDCGWFDLQKSLGQELGVDPSSFFFSSSHSHTSPDFIGAWGGVPKWYMQQVEDTVRTATKNAVASMQPAVLEAGEVLVRNRNNERRDTYRSAEENGLVWLRAIATNNMPKPAVCTTPAPSPPPPPNNGNGNGFGNQGKQTPAPAPEPTCEPAHPGSAIATLGAYAAHPVTADESTGVGDADFPAVFEKRVEEKFGGVGLFFQTGLGNVSPSGDKIEMGNGLAAAVPPIGGGLQIAGPDGSTPDVRSVQDFWNQPVTNSVLGAGGASGIFDRPMNQVDPGDSPPRDHAPVAFAGKHATRKCTSASPVWAHTAVSAARIGSVAIFGGPGETFSNFSNTLKEKNAGGVTLPLALVNDGLGYIMQSFETDHPGRQGAGFVSGELPGPADSVIEYEDAYSIDHCFGDESLERSIALLAQLR